MEKAPDTASRMHQTKEPEHKDEFDEWLARIICYAFSVPQDGDFAMHSDHVGYPQIVVFIENLEMLRPNIVSDLQQLLEDYPGWQIELTVALPEHDQDWPDMGIYVRQNEIVDALQRRFFPKEFQGLTLKYEGARRGTAYD